MSPPDDVMCYKCNTVPGTEECVRTGYAMYNMDKQNPYVICFIAVLIRNVIVFI